MFWEFLEVLIFLFDFRRILQTSLAYAIMPADNKKSTDPCIHERNYRYELIRMLNLKIYILLLRISLSAVTMYFKKAIHKLFGMQNTNLVLSFYLYLIHRGNKYG